MSAFLVTHEHINTLLRYASHQKFAPHFRLPSERVIDLTHPYDLQYAAEVLLAQNVASLNACYPDTIAKPENMPGKCDEIGLPITYRPFSHKVSRPVEIIKACDCYDYQACETDDYHQTDAARLVSSIRHCAIGNLPGYEEAEWDID